MGHSQAEKAKTHERIVAVAARKLREKGLEGIGVAELMKEAGATVGGFYKHFTSREELVTEAMESVLGVWDRTVAEGERTGKPVTFADLRDAYLTEAHCANAGEGCVFGALASELARSGPETRAAATAQLGRTFALLTRLLGKGSRKKAIAAYATLVGAVNLARISTDPALSREILAAAREALDAG